MTAGRSAWELGVQEWITKGHGNFLGMMEMFCILVVVMISLLYLYFKIITLYTYLNKFIVYKLCLSSWFLKSKKKNRYEIAFRKLDSYMVLEYQPTH